MSNHIEINNNHYEVEDDPMHLLVQDGNGSVKLTSSQKACLFDKIFDQSSFGPDRVFENPAANQPKIQSKSCLHPDLSHDNSPAEEPAVEVAEVPR